MSRCYGSSARRTGCACWSAPGATDALPCCRRWWCTISRRRRRRSPRRRGRRPIELRSAPDAAGYAGVGYLAALGAAAGQPLLVDCGEDAGLVMAALRAGCRKLAFSGPPELSQRLAEMAAQAGAELVQGCPAPALVLSPDDDARARCLAWLSAEPTPCATPKSPRQQARDATMQITPKVKEILSWYEGESPGVKGNLARLLMHGRLAGSGKLVILPVDQGYEHGPARSFASNPAAYDPPTSTSWRSTPGSRATPRRSACSSRAPTPIAGHCRRSSR